MKSTHVGTSSRVRSNKSEKVIGFNTKPYLIRTALWVVVLYLIMRFSTPMLARAFLSPNTLFLFESITPIRFLFILLFLAARLPGLIRRKFGKLIITDEMVIYDRPRFLKKWQTKIFMEDIESGKYQCGYLLRPDFLIISPYDDKKIKLVDLKLVRHAYSSIADAAGLQPEEVKH